MNKPVCWIIAGPNGAGKTTFALKYLPATGCENFINADLIASGLSPLKPEKELLTASRLFVEEVHNHIKKRTSFGFETTLSGRGHLTRVKKMLADGWSVKLIYLALPDVEMSVQRVKERVAHGGHTVAETIILRRYPRSLKNLFNYYSSSVSSTNCFMNSGKEPTPVFSVSAGQWTVQDQKMFDLLKKKACL